MTFTLQNEPSTGKAPAHQGHALRWRYVIAPAVMLTVSIITAAVFYSQLPAEVAARFDFTGTPKGWLSRELMLVLALALQFLLALAAITVAWGLARLSTMFGADGGTPARPERLLAFIGNVVALPQFVLFFTMLDIFSYNAYQTHILPPWLLGIVLLGIATIALGAFLIIAMRKARRPATNQPEQKTEEPP